MTEIASHRGGAALWPENSLLAFRETLALGVEQVEFDVQLSADGVPVVFHDETLERVTGGRGTLASHCLSELRALTLLESGEHMPTLDETLAVFVGQDIVLRCEIKPGPGLRPYPNLIEMTVLRIEAAGLLEQTIFTGFHLPTVVTITERAKGCRDVTWLAAKSVLRLLGAETVCELLQSRGIGSLAMHHSLLDERMLSTVRGHALGIATFGVVEADDITAVLRQGVDVLTTDRPDIAKAVRTTYLTPA